MIFFARSVLFFPRNSSRISKCPLFRRGMLLPGRPGDTAGLPHCTFHGLRKAAVRRLAEHGCTPHEIAAITGHATLKEIERYAKAASRKRLAESAMNKVKRGTFSG
jgi:integrase